MRRKVYCVHEASDYMPLALGMVVAHAKSARGGELNRSFDFDPTLYSSAAQLAAAIARNRPGIVLFSHYVWNGARNLDIATVIKRLFPRIITIHGGPNIPRREGECEAFVRDHPELDIVVRGEGESTLVELLTAIAAHDTTTPHDNSHGWRDAASRVEGVTVRLDDGRVVRAQDRERAVELDAYASPYLTGFFNETGAATRLCATIETNRGCPYGCTFCDWGAATLQKIRSFEDDRVRREIEWCGEHKVEVLWIADANFGVFRRDVEIAQWVAETRRKTGYPRQVQVNYAKNATERVAEIIRLWNAEGIAAEGIIAVQSVDTDVLEAIDRSNIKTSKLTELLKTFRAERLPISTDILVVLPEATVETFCNDLQFCFDRGVHAKVYHTAVLPNTPMSEPAYREKYQLVVDDAGFIKSTRTMTALDIADAYRIYEMYTALIEFGVLKYLLYWLQAEHGVKALDFIRTLDGAINRGDDDLVLLRKLLREQLAQRFDIRVGSLRYSSSLLLFPWRATGEEAARFAARAFGCTYDDALDTVLTAQEAVTPALFKPAKQSVPLRHDLAAYIRMMRDSDEGIVPEAGTLPRLSTFAPTTLVVEDPHALCHTPLELLIPYGAHKIHFELQSDLMFDVSETRFMYTPREWHLSEAVQKFAKAGFAMARRVRNNAVIRVEHHAANLLTAL